MSLCWTWTFCKWQQGPSPLPIPPASVQQPLLGSIWQQLFHIQKLNWIYSECVKMECFIKLNLRYKELEANHQWDVAGISYSPLSMRTKQGEVWSVTVSVHSQDYETPSTCPLPWKTIVSGGFSEMEAQKVKRLKTRRFSQGKSLSETKAQMLRIEVSRQQLENKPVFSSWNRVGFRSVSKCKCSVFALPAPCFP